jgi:hypothetical protein
MIYFYARTDNRKDLERLRRVVALAKQFEDAYLMTTDFRAASYAKRLGVKKAVGIEDFRNTSQIAPRGSVLVFDSDEHLENDYVHQEMIDYFRHFIRISYDPKDTRKDGEILISPYIVGEGVINAVLVDEEFLKPCKKSIDKLYFWGDADYEKELVTRAHQLKALELDLLEGLYFFAGYDDELAPYFQTIHECDEHIDTVKSAKVVVSSEPQTLLEAAAAGAKVLYLPKKEESEYLPLLERLGILNVGTDWSRAQEGLLQARRVAKDLFEKLGVVNAKKRLEELMQINEM